MNHLIGVLPVVGTGSMDGFAAGILVAGACFFALATPWRMHRRDAPARDETPPKPRPETWTWRPPVPAAREPRRYAASVRPGPDQTSQLGSALAEHRRLSSDRPTLGNVNAVQQHWGLPADPGSRASAEPAPPGEARSPGSLESIGSGDANPRSGSHRAAHPLGDPTFGAPAGQQKPPGGRHAPRHAAPAPSLSGKMTGLFTTRSLADSNHG